MIMSVNITSTPMFVLWPVLMTFPYLIEDENMEEMAAKEGVISSSSTEFMNEQLARNNKLIVACFTSRCSQPCELMFPVIDDLAEKMPEVTFLNVDLFCSRLENAVQKWQVETTPTIMFIKNGEVLDKFVGVVRGELLQRNIAKHAPLVDTKKKARQKDEPLTCPLGWWEGHENEDISQIFEDYCKEYRKTYMSDKEKLRRFKVFKYNHEYERQNDKYFNTRTPAEFDGLSDYTKDELVSIYSEHPFRYNITILDGCRKGQVVFCDTVEAWNEQLAKGQGISKLVVVGFFAEWCPPCKLMRPVLRYLAKNMPEVTFLEVDVVWEELKNVGEKLGVEAIPTFMLLKNGEVVDKVVGAVRDELQLKIAAHASVDASA